MAMHGISPPRVEPARSAAIPHDRWLADRLTGTLRLRFATPPEQYVSPGSGRLGIAHKGGREVAALRTARRQGVPIVPGSGIKGAVRTLYELFSASCNPLLQNHRGRCRAASCCDACSLFGFLGWGGRVGFSDATPTGEDALSVDLVEVPIPWKPNGDRTPGDFRIYDLQRKKALQARPGERSEPPKTMTREVYRGTFEGRMIFWNLTESEIARVLLAMGLGADPKTRFLLRLGGVKYDGKGAVSVTPIALELRQPLLSLTDSEACGAHFEPWLQASRDSSWGRTYWPTLELTARTLGART